MPGGQRSILSPSRLLDLVHKRNTKVNLTKTMEEHGYHVPSVDISIHFIGASDIPKMDVIGHADPYFVAKIDDKVTFVSTVIQNQASPVWNEYWRVKNVPTTASLIITVMDKDEGSYTDDFIGSITTTVTAGAKELELEGPFRKHKRGRLWLKIESTPAKDENPLKFPYLFDGPIRYSHHFSPTVGYFTNIDEKRLYSTWKVYLTKVPQFFGDTHQHWNEGYDAAQRIFQGPTSTAVRRVIRSGHRLLYARTAANGFGVIDNAVGFIALLKSKLNGSDIQRVKPAVYTYVIGTDDDCLRFSETGAAFFVDFASKHALHSNCGETVRYSGEFHPRPRGGWENFSDDIPDDAVEWELVIDNNSGTYAPDKTLLPALRALFESNFPGLTFYAMDYKDEELKKSTEACRNYALKFRGVNPQEWHPHAEDGETTLMASALSVRYKTQ